jgi:hypothetical protein
VQDVQGFLTFSDDQIREVFDRYKDNEGLIDARKVRHSFTHSLIRSTIPPIAKHIFISIPMYLRVVLRPT